MLRNINIQFRKSLSKKNYFSSKPSNPIPTNSTAKPQQSPSNGIGGQVFTFLFSVGACTVGSVYVYDNWSDSYENHMAAVVLEALRSTGELIRKSKYIDDIYPPKKLEREKKSSKSAVTERKKIDKIIALPESEGIEGTASPKDAIDIVPPPVESVSESIPVNSTPSIDNQTEISSTNSAQDEGVPSDNVSITDLELASPTLPEGEVESVSDDRQELEALLEEVVAEDASSTKKHEVADGTVSKHDAQATASEVIAAHVIHESIVEPRPPAFPAAYQAYSAETHNHIQLKKELHASILHDLGSLSEADLKRKITQLAGELFERTRWEGVRMQQSLKRVEAEVTQTYRERLDQQRRDIEKESSAAMQQMEHDLVARSADQSTKAILLFETQLAEAMRDQAVQFDAKRRQELEKQAGLIKAENSLKIQAEVKSLEAAHSQRVLRTGQEVENLHAHLTTLNENLDSNIANRKKSVAVLTQVNVVHALEHAVFTSRFGPRPFALSASLDKVRAAFPGDAFVQTVIDSVPSAAKQTGILSEHLLTTRFLVLRDEMRKVALAPPSSSSMVGHLIGSFLATISAVPKAPIAGSGVEETLSRVTHHIEQGQLAEALREIESVGGVAGKLADDWKTLVRTRLAAELAAETLKTYAHLIQTAHAK